jgi:transposase, IS5 family
MVKILPIEQLFDLSDEPMAFQSPDRSTIWTSRKRLIKVSANAGTRYKLVRKIRASTASEHAPRFADVLDPADTNCNILADNGDVDGDREPRPTNDGRRMHIQRKGGNDKPISATQERRNTPLARSTRGSRSPDRQHQSM